MVNHDLIVEIESRFQRGQRKDDIKKELVKNGWVEKEVDDAIAYLQRLALKEIPIVASIIIWWEKFEEKVMTISPRTALLLLCGLAVLVILIGVGLYIVVDPSGTRVASRDEQRRLALGQLKAALTSYYEKNNIYPARLTSLAPDYMSSVPRDPGSGKEYQYKLLDEGGYELCIPFELTDLQCVTVSGISQNTQAPLTEMTVPSVSVPSTSHFVISGLLFTDINNDKVQQSGEAGVGSEVVYVADDTGKEVCKKITNSSGAFICEVTNPGAYFVFLDEKTKRNVLGAHPQKVMLPPAENPTATSVQVALRVSAESPGVMAPSGPVTSRSPSQ